MSALATVALLFHALIETPAAASFLLAPQRQVQIQAQATHVESSEVALVCQNLGGLLVASVLVSLVLVCRGDAMDPATRGLLVLSLASYHVFPSRRAYVRLRLRHGKHETSTLLGGPRVHLVVHLVCLTLLLSAGLADIVR